MTVGLTIVYCIVRIIWLGGLFTRKLVVYSTFLQTDFTIGTLYLDYILLISAGVLSTIYFKKQAYTLTLYGIFVLSLFLIFPRLLAGSTFYEIKDHHLNHDYIIERHDSNLGNDKTELVVFVYKEILPLVYVNQGRYHKIVSTKSETYSDFWKLNYVVNKDGNYLTFKGFLIPLK
ncbi:hypothetical protein MHI39_21640 [Heyndrickxia sp. FSL K6-6286]|uniref:hypothetical protein n=1 Tax=Heyndrickxia sp. FSL K6-6286 TaxID=2921510 RepID=UPI00315AE7AE